MVAAAELGALADEVARVGDAHPERLHAARHGVELGQELRGVKGVQYVGGGDVEADHGAHGDRHDRRVIGSLEPPFGDGVGAVEHSHHLVTGRMANWHRAVDRAFDGHDITGAGDDAHVLDSELERHERHHQGRILEM